MTIFFFIFFLPFSFLLFPEFCFPLKTSVEEFEMLILQKRGIRIKGWSCNHKPSTASWEVGDCPLRPIQNWSLSLAISSSIPLTLALLQKYVSHACARYYTCGGNQQFNTNMGKHNPWIYRISCETNTKYNSIQTNTVRYVPLIGW